MTSPRRLLVLLASLSLLASASASAGERGLVANSGGVLKADPKPKGKKVDKLKQGTMVDVVDHTADKQWLKVSYKGENGPVEGWVEKAYVRSLSRYGFSWERKDAKPSAGSTTSSPKGDAGGKTKAADAKTAPAATPAAEDEGWGTESASPSGDADSDWDNTTPEGDAASSGGGDEGWGDEGAAEAATPAPARSATPEPAATPAADGTETEVDLTQ